MDRSVKTGVRVLVDRSASMSTQQNGATRFDAAIAALRSVASQQQSAIACFTLSAFDLEVATMADSVASAGELLDLCLSASAAAARHGVVARAARAREAGTAPVHRDGCATRRTIVVSDMPAPPWMDGRDGPAPRGDVWIDVSHPAPNAGVADLVDNRDRVSGEVRRVRAVVGTFGGMATSNVRLSVRSPDGTTRTHPVEAWDGPTGSVDVTPTEPGRYTFQVNPGGAYRYDDEAAIDVPRSAPFASIGGSRVVNGSRDWDGQRIVTTPTCECCPRSRCSISFRPLSSDGLRTARAPSQPVTTFLETSPLVNGLNLDVAERSGMRGAPSLPPGSPRC